MRLLLIEDNPNFSRSLTLSLEEEGYTVEQSFDGLNGEGLARLGAGERTGTVPWYDAIFLDVNLPVKDGIAVCRDLRQAG